MLFYVSLLILTYFMRNFFKEKARTIEGLGKFSSAQHTGHTEGAALDQAIDLKKMSAKKDLWTSLAKVYAEGGEAALESFLFSNDINGKRPTREQLLKDSDMQKELKVLFSENSEGLTLDDFLTALPTEEDYVQHAKEKIAETFNGKDDEDLELGEPIEFAKGTDPNIRVSNLIPPRQGRDYSNLPPLPVIGKEQPKRVIRSTEDLRNKLGLGPELKKKILARKQREEADYLEETKKGIKEIAAMSKGSGAQNISEDNFLRQSPESLKFNQEDRQYLLEVNTKAQQDYIAAYRKFFKLTSRPDLSKPKEYKSDNEILTQPLRIPLLRRLSGEARALKELQAKVVKAGEALEAAEENKSK